MTTSPKFQLNRADGSIDQQAVAAMADRRAHAVIAKCAAIGWTRNFETVRAQELIEVQLIASTRRDSIVAATIRASLPDFEQLARTLDLAAELAEAAIPPRKAEAANLRERAAMLRAAELQTQAA